MILSQTFRGLFVKSSIAAILAITLAGQTASAAVIINVTEVGGDVLFSTSGSLDLTGATKLLDVQAYLDGFIPGGSNWYIASGSGGNVTTYALTSFAGAFGTSGAFFSPPDSTSGDDFFIWGQGGATEQVGVPIGYISGAAIVSQMVFNGATIAGFTMIHGTYLYTIPNDTITLNIAGAAVPEPASLSLLALGLAGFARLVRKRRSA